MPPRNGVIRFPAVFSFKDQTMPNPLIDRIPDSYEVRSFTDDVRMDAEIGTFTGHASAFNYVDSYQTAFDRKAFNKTITDKEGRIPVLFFHERTEMIGPVRTLKPDKVGLYHESKAIEDGRTGTYVLAHMRGGTPMGMSFGFSTRKDRAATDDDLIDLSTAPQGTTLSDVRLITEVELFEISVLPWTFASQPKADVANVRAKFNTPEETITSLMDSMTAGTLTDEEKRRLDELVTAYQQRAEADQPITSLDDERARRNTNIRIALALAEAEGYLTGVPA
jgi:HK97 family phage prohead protease